MGANFPERLASLLSTKITDSEKKYGDYREKSDNNSTDTGGFDDLQPEKSEVGKKNIQFAHKNRGNDKEKIAVNFQKIFATKNRTGKIVRAYNYIESVPQEIDAAFAVLGCQHSCTLRDVHTAFRKKIKEFHPDIKNNGESQNILINIEETEKNQDAAQIIDAYEKLSDWFLHKNTGKDDDVV